MKQTIPNIRFAYNNKLRYANKTSDSGVVELTHAVREIAYQFYDELQIAFGNGKLAGYKFIQQKLNEYGWTGYEFTTPIPEQYEHN